jgi:broad specificity phosphatase PhoE
LNSEPDPVLGQLFDLGLHLAIQAEALYPGARLRLFILTRHGRSVLNATGRINGNPTVPVPLTPEGREAAERLGRQLAELPIDLCIHTRFARTVETARCILGARDVPFLEEPLLDDIDVGDLEGCTLEQYHAWKAEHARADAFPGGESLDDAAHRYTAAYRRLLERSEATTLVVCHEIPIRYALNAAAGSDDLDRPEHSIPNATPYLFDERSLARAADGIEKDAGGPRRMAAER